MKQFCVIFLPIFCLACATAGHETKILAEPKIDYVITTYDQPEDERFLISIKSTSENDICLYRGTWPSLLAYRQHPARGELISQLDAEIRVISRTSEYAPRNITTGGHCQAETLTEVQKLCSQRLESGQTRMTALPYKYFDLAILSDEDKNKRLSYSANLPFCDVFP